VDLGIIKGRVIGKNRDGDKDRVVLQVELTDGDMRTVELIAQSGQDENPADECRVYVIDVINENNYMIAVAVSDDLASEVDPGEKEIYSTDSPATTKKARVKFNGDGVLDLNGNSDFAVRFNTLKTEFDKLKADYNSHTHAYLPGPGSSIPTATPLPQTVADITGAKVDEVKLP